MPKGFAGFTLIEVVLVIAIVGILAGLGIPSYGNFKKNQELEQASQNLKSNLRFAQSQALAGVRSNCTNPLDSLFGWYVQMGNPYNIGAVCGQGTSGTAVAVKQISLPSGFTMSVPSSYIVFQTTSNSVVFVNGFSPFPPVSSADSVIITVSNSSGQSKTITVRKTGDIP